MKSPSWLGWATFLKRNWGEDGDAMQSHSGCRDDYAHSLLCMSCMSFSCLVNLSREVVLLWVVFVCRKWPNFERLKHCEDRQFLNGVVFQHLHVSLKFSSWEVLALNVGCFAVILLSSVTFNSCRSSVHVCCLSHYLSLVNIVYVS